MRILWRDKENTYGRDLIFNHKVIFNGIDVTDISMWGSTTGVWTGSGWIGNYQQAINFGSPSFNNMNSYKQIVFEFTTTNNIPLTVAFITANGSRTDVIITSGVPIIIPVTFTNFFLYVSEQFSGQNPSFNITKILML